MAEDSSIPVVKDTLQQELAKSLQRDENGRFIKSTQNHEKSAQGENDPEKEEKLPGFIKIVENKSYKADDPPMIGISLTNPVTYFKLWLKKLLSNEGIDFRFRIKPLTAIFLTIFFAAFVSGTSFSIAKWYFLPILVPNFFNQTPISYSGTAQKSNNQFLLVTVPNSQVFTLKNNNLDFSKFVGSNILVTGKLDKRTNSIEVIELIDLGKTRSVGENITPVIIHVPYLTKESSASALENNTYKSPDGNSEIIISGHYGDKQNHIILKGSDKEEILGPTFLPLNLKWSKDSEKIALETGGPGFGTQVEIIEIVSKKKIPVVGEVENFTKLFQSNGSYTHIFSSIVDWIDPDKLIIEVSGKPDESPDSPLDSIFYLIDATTGKIIKKI